MTHRITLTSNPRLIALALVVLAMFAVAVAAFATLTPLFGGVFLALTLFLAYNFARFAQGSLRSRVATSEAGISFILPTREQENLPWEVITHAGYCTQPRGKPFLFVYAESRDRLISIPREYTDFDALVEQVRSATPFEEMSLASGETIQERLRERLGIDPEGGERER